MSTINLSNILDELRSPAEMVKTAAVNVTKESPKKVETQRVAAQMTKTAAQAPKVAETPAANTPTGGLNKLASDLAAVEHQTMVKEAQVFGSTMADAFASRLGDIQNVLDNSATPTDSGFTKTAEDQQMEKIATELYSNMDNDDVELVNTMVKTAADNGHNLRPEEAFSVLADEAILLGEKTAMEKIAAVDIMSQLPTSDKDAINLFTKTAQEKGYNMDRIDSFQHMAKTAMERGEAACIIDNLPMEDKAAITGFTKTAQAQGHNIDQIEAFQYMAKTAMAQGAQAAKNEDNTMTKEAAEQNAEFVAMEKIAADMEAKGDKVGLAKLEKYAYDKGFEETLTKVAAHTSGLGYAQTDMLLKSLNG